MTAALLPNTTDCPGDPSLGKVVIPLNISDLHCLCFSSYWVILANFYVDERISTLVNSSPVFI